jgi:uncharacterized membrane protein
MAEQRFCQQCGQRHDCQDVYQKVGGGEGPSLVSKAVVAFAVPLLFFIICLAVSERLLAKTLSAERLRTVAAFVFSVSATFLLVVVIGVISGRFGKSK